MPLKGFFGSEEATPKKIPLYLSPQCGQCKLDRGCESPKMPIDGEGRKKILIVAEAPGQREDEKGIPLCGKTGSFLEETLKEFDIDMRKDCWLTNAIRCRPPGNATPTDKQIGWCRPWLTSANASYGEIHKLQPQTILLLGGAAVRSVIGWLWKEDTGGVNKWIGWQIPCQRLNCWITSAWHPSFVVRERDNKNPNRAVELVWHRHLKAAVSHKKLPWKTVPDYKSQVIVEMVPRQAAHLVKEITRMGKLTSVDIETTCRKPDSKAAQIWSCAVSNGVVTVSFPWQGEVVEAVANLLASGIPITCHGSKFEQRWFEAKGMKIKNLKFCSMLAAHVLDNRPGTKSLKFQAFALLGQESYDDHIKPYFGDNDESNKPNKIHKLDLRTLLVYGGLDSLFGYLITKKQASQLGMEF